MPLQVALAAPAPWKTVALGPLCLLTDIIFLWKNVPKERDLYVEAVFNFYL